MYDAYGRIFKRVGINARPVVADSGAIGGSHTHEFMALSEIGEDTSGNHLRLHQQQYYLNLGYSYLRKL